MSQYALYCVFPLFFDNVFHVPWLGDCKNVQKISFSWCLFEGRPRQGKNGCQMGSIGCLSLVLLNWDSQLGRTFFLPFQRNLSISFKAKVAIAKFVWKMQKKKHLVHIMKRGLDVMPLFLLDDLLNASNATEFLVLPKSHLFFFLFLPNLKIKF